MMKANTPTTRILVVDDSADNQLAYRTTLSGDYDVVLVDSGRDALKHLMNDEFALILLDVVMPDMNGFETAALIRARQKTKAVPIIFITAYTSDEVKSLDAYAIGAADFITTPIDPEVLKAKVAAFVNLYRYNKAREALLEQEIHAEKERKESESRLAEARQRTELMKQQQEYERRTNEMLIQRSKEFEQFAFIASHDLKAPLRTISNYLALFQNKYRGRLDQQADEYIKFVVDGAQRLSHLIDDLLTFSRVGSSTPQVSECNLEEVVNEVKRDLKSLIDETQGKILCHPLPTLRADRSQMVQLLQNLISNSLIHRGKHPPVVEISGVETPDGNVEFSVKDNGVGFEMKFATEIFKMFKSLHRDEHGTGIGLAICQRIVERHHGEIWAKSKVGEGSTFTFSLPGGVDRPRNSLAGLRVLIVDDARDVRDLATELLKDAQVELDTVDNGKAALDYLKTKRYDVILLDIMMPGMDGWETCERIRRSGFQTPIVAFTTIGTTDEYKRKGFTDHFAKDGLGKNLLIFLDKYRTGGGLKMVPPPPIPLNQTTH